MSVRRWKRRGGAKWIIIRLAAAGVALTAAGVMFLELRLRPVVQSVAGVQAKSLAVTEINEAVTDILAEEGITGESLENITADETGMISSVCTDTAAVNRLKNLITLRSQERLCSIRNRRVDVPFGTLSGLSLLNGTGPCLPVYSSLSGTVTSDFDSRFESGGINQTVHTLSVTVRADIDAVMPLCSASESVETSVLVGETVIVGNTPSGLIMKN